MDIRQSNLYAKYMEKIGWVVEEVDGVKIFIKKFPLLGSVIKIQRPDRVLQAKLLDQLAKKYRARTVSLEFSAPVHPRGVPQAQHHLGGVLGNGFKINTNPYLPTKTIQIDLTVSEEKIFQRFTEAKRRAVRRAIKNGVVVKQVDNIEEFIKLKSKDFWSLGYWMGKDMRVLWESFRPKNVSVILAYKKNTLPSVFTYQYITTNEELVAGILLLFYGGMAYYWMAASTGEGKKVFAPTLLVWGALKIAKKKGCNIFDFEGIYDPRFHNTTKRWRGFTKFKEGFVGEEIIFPEPLIKHYPPSLKLRRGFA